MAEAIEEVWKVIDTDPDYKISTLGRVMSCKWGKEKQMTICLDKDKYYIVSLRTNGKRSTPRIHRLIALAFIPNPDNLPTVDHIDRNNQNNIISNLRWASYKTQVKNRTKKRSDILEEDPRLRQNIMARESYHKNKASGKYSCEPCGYTFESPSAKAKHEATATHLKKINNKIEK